MADQDTTNTNIKIKRNAVRLDQSAPRFAFVFTQTRNHSDWQCY